MKQVAGLSPSMEDYLEAILSISQKQGTARVSEIARRLEIAASSVNEVIAKLSEMGLVEQEKYGPVILTKSGRNYAQKIRCRHQIIREFLTRVLEIDQGVADRDACMMEHVVSNVTMHKLVSFLRENYNIEIDGECLQYLEEGSEPQAMKTKNVVSLDKLETGDSGRVVKISAGGSLKRRLLDMGLLKGVELTLKGKAPLGDPLELSVKGYNLSLRRQEAENIYVEVD